MPQGAHSPQGVCLRYKTQNALRDTTQELHEQNVLGPQTRHRKLLANYRTSYTVWRAKVGVLAVAATCEVA